jgi:hypothetical protein
LCFKQLSEIEYTPMKPKKAPKVKAPAPVATADPVNIGKSQSTRSFFKKNGLPVPESSENVTIDLAADLDDAEESDSEKSSSSPEEATAGDDSSDNGSSDELMAFTQAASTQSEVNTVGSDFLFTQPSNDGSNNKDSAEDEDRTEEAEQSADMEVDEVMDPMGDIDKVPSMGDDDVVDYIVSMEYDG